MKRKNVLLKWALYFVLFILVDVYRWEFRHKPLSSDQIVGNIAFAAVFSWLMTLSHDAWLIGFLSWGAATALCLFAFFKLTKSFFPSSFASMAFDYGGYLLPLLVTVGAVLLWQRRERMKEIRTIR